MLRKEPARFEVLNDIDGEVVNFFRVLRERPAELLRLIALTPFARQEALEAFHSESTDPVERARCLYVRAWQCMGGPRTQHSGWRFSIGSSGASRSAVEEWGNIGHLAAVTERLKRIQIENDPAAKVIKRYDAETTLFYCDPPYLPETRSERWGKKGYTHEMTPADHARLAEQLRGIKGMAVVSGYPSELYEGLFAGWARVEKETITDKAARRVEVLWVSPLAAARIHSDSLFGGAA